MLYFGTLCDKIIQKICPSHRRDYHGDGCVYGREG